MRSVFIAILCSLTIHGQDVAQVEKKLERLSKRTNDDLASNDPQRFFRAMYTGIFSVTVETDDNPKLVQLRERMLKVECDALSKFLARKDTVGSFEVSVAGLEHMSSSWWCMEYALKSRDSESSSKKVKVKITRSDILALVAKAVVSYFRPHRSVYKHKELGRIVQQILDECRRDDRDLQRQLIRTWRRKHMESLALSRKKLQEWGK